MIWECSFIKFQSRCDFMGMRRNSASFTGSPGSKAGRAARTHELYSRLSTGKRSPPPPAWLRLPSFQELKQSYCWGTAAPKSQQEAPASHFPLPAPQAHARSSQTALEMCEEGAVLASLATPDSHSGTMRTPGWYFLLPVQLLPSLLVSYPSPQKHLVSFLVMAHLYWQFLCWHLGSNSANNIS